MVATTVIKTLRQSNADSPWNTGIDGPYLAWRDQKLACLASIPTPADRVEIRDLADPSGAERAEIMRRCQVSNAAFYVSEDNSDDMEKVRQQLQGFARAMGLNIAEKHRSAGDDGIVALRQSKQQSQRAYIPYSKKPMNWHTDGYYNRADQKIRAMVLHCVNPASDGGVNQFLDPEIAYLRLRDENPNYIKALMHPAAMTIPENREKDGSLRPVSIGPVFSVCETTGHLEMRYTARTRSIQWRDDDMTAQAVAHLQVLLAADDPFIQTTKMQAGEGILCNNSLHNRTGFDPNLNTDSNRLIYRIRFHNRVSGS